MAINGFDGQQVMMAQMAQRQQMNAMQTAAFKPTAGTLYVADSFYSGNSNQLPHGDIVTLSARRDGFQGPILQNGIQSSEKPTQRMKQGGQTLLTPNSTPEQTRKGIAEYSKGRSLDFIEGTTSTLDGLSANKAQNSVINLSQSVSTARITESLYNTASSAWDKTAPPEFKADGITVARNFSAAYGLDFNKLNSSDPKVSGPERAKLQKALIGDVDKSMHGDCEVGAAQAKLRTAVQRFESNRNSVVMSSGNDNEVLSDLKKDANGFSFGNPPSKFTENVISTPEATVVGATRWFKGTGNGPTEKLASYSNTGSNVDIWASGSVDVYKDGKGVDTYGTSFSAPRVAATMAALHKANPKMSSAQIELLMKTKLTHQLETSQGTIPVLDYQKSSDFMVGRQSGN